MIRNSGLGHFPVCFSSRDTYYSNVDVVEDTRRSTSFTTIARNHHYHKRDSCCPAFRHTAILLSTLVVRIRQLVCVCVCQDNFELNDLSYPYIQHAGYPDTT